MRSRLKLLTKKEQALFFLLNIAAVYLCMFITVYMIHFYMHNIFPNLLLIELIISVILTTLLGSIFGYLSGLLFCVIIFTYSLMVGFEWSFGMFMYMIIVSTADYFARHFYYESRAKIWRSIFIMNTIVWVGWFLVAMLIVNGNLEPRHYVMLGLLYVGQLFDFMVCSTISSLCFHRAPDKWKRLMTNCFQYTEEYKKEYVEPGFHKNSGLENRVITALVVAVIMVIFATSIYMLPDKTLLYFKENDHKYIALYVIKHLMVLSIYLVPIIVLTNHLVQEMAIEPIRRMGYFLQIYGDLDDRKREDYLIIFEDIRPQTQDEITTLYNSTHQLIHELDDNFKQIKEDEIIADTIRIEDAANEAKSNFISSMSHEIRTPINAVLGMDEMILRDTTDPVIREYANNIKEAGTTLLKLVNDVLDYSALESGKMEMIFLDYELDSMINDQLTPLLTEAEKKNLDFKVKINPKTPVHLIGDEVHIGQCIRKLMENAIKYTDHGFVSLDLNFEWADSKHINLQVTIEDSGMGMKDEEISRLSTAFERGDENRNRNVLGLGVGMSITQELLKLMGSELKIISTYDVGSQVSFILNQEVRSTEEIGDFNTIFENAKANRNVYETRLLAPDASILVVDDNTVNLTVAKGLLKPTLIQVDTAESGAEALELIKKKTYDVIFLDHRMPVMDGLETFAKIQDIENYDPDKTRIIALTANVTSGAKTYYQNIGFANYMAKPIDSSVLEKMLRKYLPEERIFS